MKLTHFKDIDFLQAIKGLFKELKVPMNYVADEPTSAQEILKDTYKDNSTFALVEDVYFVGMVDDAAFENNESLNTDKIKSDYDGVLIFGITLYSRQNNLLPTRSQLAEISRAFNREFYYTPVVVVYKYKDDNSNYIAFANTERLQYKQAWREGEKSGKVSLLRDINIEKPHRGHEDIINQLKIPTSGKNQVDSFAKLYMYWQEVFSVNVLNKKFYQELSNWYFWAIKHVTFPNQPTIEDAHNKKAELADLVQEHNAKNVIRLLTRLLFTWFIKEKKLIPEALFDLNSLQQDILNEISPYHDENSLFSDANQDSVYYKAILQNLFFATLNCPIKSDGIDNRKRGFRGLETYGKHRGIDWMMRYKSYFKNPDKFLEMMNETVPFLNGGLFECLDDKTQNVYIDGFSDQMTKSEKLIVPDYLFFGVEEKVDLSKDYGIKNKKAKEAAVKGLINILKSYKFTITENTPIEEDVALDPELLGKVFENLLASYNPETKTTARKQTGSFYTPREIVNYMVDESLIAYLKNEITDWIIEENMVDEYLHQLFSFDSKNPFVEHDGLQKQIIKAIDKCTILDPACGSGAFPMGALQKIVHVLGKLDPNNIHWQDLQLEKAQRETEGVFSIQDKKEREQLLIDINDAFDEALNNPDYARKLYLIENCIYGVDIQSIATQISKLRFFISLVVDQKINADKENFGIRPLPNLETKFVAANTLIGIDKPTSQTNLFDTTEVKALEKELKRIRHKLFNAKTKETKLKYRLKDEELRKNIASELKQSGWSNDISEKLASWDPYDQNASSPFFDPEWMFDLKKGFDIVIGNPPYRPIQKYEKSQKNIWAKIDYKTYTNSGNIYFLFYERGLQILRERGSVNYITSNQWMRNVSGEPLRKFFLSYNPEILIDFRGTKIFENVAVLSNILLISNKKSNNSVLACDISTIQNNYIGLNQIVNDNSILLKDLDTESWLIFEKNKHNLRQEIVNKGRPLKDWDVDINYGIKTGFNEAFYLTESEKNVLIEIDSKNSEIIKPMLRGRDLKRYYPGKIEYWLIHTSNGKYVGRGIERKGRVQVEKDYPSIYEHMLNYRVKLEKRQDKGEHWTNLRSCDYDEAFQSPKMIFMNMSKDLIFSFDPEGLFLTNQKCFIVTGSHTKFLTAFFNSNLFRYFFKDNFPELLGDVREVSKVYLEKIPVIQPSNSRIRIIEFFVDLIIIIKSRSLSELPILTLILEGLFAEFYFPEHMKEQKIDILYFVEKDIKDVIQDRCFANFTDIEKEEVIEQFHSIWSHPDNELRNRIKLFAVRSPLLLKPILET